MREILFRGKRTDNGEWVEGDLVHSYFKVGDTCINASKENLGFYEVDPSTVDQYTGLCDKNGKKIFEGDVGTGRNMLHPQRNKYEVVYEDNGFYFCDEKGVTWHPEHIDYFEIVGNIHDNPELLEVSHE